jgi:hypothetical protein
MKNRKNNNVVVEDIWMNTHADANANANANANTSTRHNHRGATTGDRPIGTTTPAPHGRPTSWDEVEQANSLLNPDASNMDRG